MIVNENLHTVATNLYAIVEQPLNIKIQCKTLITRRLVLRICCCIIIYSSSRFVKSSFIQKISLTELKKYKMFSIKIELHANSLSTYNDK